MRIRLYLRMWMCVRQRLMVPDPSGLCESVSVLGPSGLQGEQRG